jgi:ribonuclease R
VVHRVVKRYLAGDRSQAAEDPTFEELARHLNEATWKASKAEAERMRMLVARIFRERVGEVVEGNVVAIKPFGLVVQMVGTGATGTIAIESLPGGPYRVERHGQELVGERRSFAVGDALEARVLSTNEDLGRVDLELLD